MKERRSYTKEYKKEIVEKIIKSHKSPKNVAKESGIPIKTLEKWFTAYRKDKYVFDKDNISMLAEIKKLQKDNKKLKKDKEALNKAVQVAAKNNIGLYEIITHLRKEYPVSYISHLINVNLSAYNHWYQKIIKKNQFNIKIANLENDSGKLGGGVRNINKRKKRIKYNEK